MSNLINKKRDWVYSAKTLDELKDRYDSWANEYETDLKDPYKQFCLDMGRYFTKFVPNLNSLILDIGCGTGMVGEGLVAHGYSNLVGVDISENMLAVAKKKNIYKNLRSGDIREIDSLYETEYFDAAICVGVFTYGHVKPVYLGNVLNILKLNSFLGLTVIKELFDSNNEFKTIIDKLPVNLIEKKEVIISGESWKDIVVYNLILQKR
ncbi:MAG: class I SAM-dependent methyltransferase [Cyanobacteria bacterium P01_F01_bin.150]